MYSLMTQSETVHGITEEEQAELQRLVDLDNISDYTGLQHEDEDEGM